MNRTKSPVHLHVDRKAPVHVHVTSSPRPDRKAASSTKRMKASEWTKAASASSKGPWVPPPAKTTRNAANTSSRMCWEGPTHRLEIEPGFDGESTCLHVSDFEGDTTDIIVEPAKEGSNTHTKLDTLTAEVSMLRNEIELQKGLQEHKKKKKEIQLEEEVDDAVQINSNRESLVQAMTEAELDINAVNRQTDIIKEALRLLIRDKSLSPSRAREVTEQGIVLQDRLSELQIGLKATKHLLRSQQIKESKIRRYSEELEILQQRVKETEKRNKMLNEEIKDKETLTLHSHQLHQQIGIKDNEIQSQVERLQLLEQQLEYKQLECQRLEEELRNVKKKAELDKDCLKRSNKQHKDKAWQSEKSLESLNIQIDHLNSELEVEKSRCSRLVREKAAIESSAQSLRIQLKEVQDAVNEYQRKLSIKTRDASALQLENEQNKTVIGTLEEQLKGNETVANSRIMSAQTDIRELQCAVTQYESLISDYKSQLEKSHKEIDRLVQEIHKKDMEIEQLQHDSYMELEKSKIAYHKQLTDMEPLTDHLKTTELKLQESEEKLSVYEQRYTDQTRTIADLTAKAASADSLKERLQEKKIECKSAGAKIEMFEKRIRDMEGQNKELIMITSRKEELVKQLQLKEENYIEEIGSLNRQLDGIKCDSKRQMESLREKCDLKEKSHMSRQMDMETQLKRVNGQLDQMKKSKDENERKLQHKVKELQERLDHCQATKKALESYLSFIKSSYASIFNDTSMPLDTWSSPITQ